MAKRGYDRGLPTSSRFRHMPPAAPPAWLKAAPALFLLLWSSGLGMFAGEWSRAPSHSQSRMQFGMALITLSMFALGFDSLLH